MISPCKEVPTARMIPSLFIKENLPSSYTFLSQNKANSQIVIYGAGKVGILVLVAVVVIDVLLIMMKNKKIP